MACRTERSKRDLVRVVRSGSGELKVDARGKAPGRGAYLCPDPACLERGLAEGSLARALSVGIDDETRSLLRVDLDGVAQQRSGGRSA